MTFVPQWWHVLTIIVAVAQLVLLGFILPTLTAIRRLRERHDQLLIERLDTIDGKCVRIEDKVDQHVRWHLNHSRLVDENAWAVMTIWLEARGEPYEGKVGVAEVIRNRTALRVWSDGTVSGTCLMPFQFSGWNTNDPSRRFAARVDDDDQVVHECRAAWDEALSGSQRVLGATHYYAPIGIAPPHWADPAKQVAVIGRHHFYRGVA